MAHRSLIVSPDALLEGTNEPVQEGMMREWKMWILVGTVLFWSAAALAVDPAIRCEAAKLKAAGKYAACRLQAEAKAARSLSQPDFADCDAKFADKWESVERKTLKQGIPCWTMNDMDAVKESVATSTSSVANSLSCCP
jgi:hypothetical protein